MSDNIELPQQQSGISKKQKRVLNKREREMAERARRARETAENLERQMESEGITKDDDKDLNAPETFEEMTPQPEDENVTASHASDEEAEVTDNKLRSTGASDHVVRFDHLIKEIAKWDFNVIQIDTNMDGDYEGKESLDIHENDGKTVPNTLLGLLANGTKFFDAVVYIGMEESRRPKAIKLELSATGDGPLSFPTYDDVSKLTTYIFVVYFYIVIRAHPPSDNGAYQNQPMPKFITTVMNCRESIFEIANYLASFDLIKLNPVWVRYIPTTHISQEAMNRLGLGVAGYRLVSVFNIVEPDLYTSKTDEKNEYKQAQKPKYLDTAIAVIRSFELAGYCWDFHPATRNPTIISKYGNINKNASNLMLEAYTTETLRKN
ncbi:hypothetical protein HI914_02550 [Erysiphe necator]|nr:hypothetical protein HI914_02550 [Erysiphe necator]